MDVTVLSGIARIPDWACPHEMQLHVETVLHKSVVAPFLFPPLKLFRSVWR